MRFQPPSWCRAPRDPQRQLVRFSSGRSVELLDGALYTLGRTGGGADILITGELSSRLHAAVLQDSEGRKFLVDLRSANGTFLDGARLAPHAPTRWAPGAAASFGSGPAAEVLVLEDVAKRGRVEPEPPEEPRPRDAPADLYGGLPEATVEFVKRDEREEVQEPLVAVDHPSKILFLDVDGCLRSVHGTKDFMKHTRTMEVDGIKVPLLGKSESRAGIDFWPNAMRAVRHIVAKTGARIVLSSDWRKDQVLREGVGNSLEEYRIPPLYGCTPDLDHCQHGVLKALHTSFREKRCKEIRKFLRTQPDIVRWVAIDDIDLSMPDKEARLQEAMQVALKTQAGERVFLDPLENFVRCNPSQGLNMELAKLAISMLNGLPVSEEDLERVYGQDAQ